MKLQLVRFPLTSAAVLLAAVALAGALIGNINIIDLPLGLIGRIEQHEIDEIVTVIVLVVVALIADHVLATRRLTREIGLQNERLRVVRVTMRTVQDIVNNCLNQLQLVRFEAEGHVPDESLALFDQAIHETAGKLKALGELDTYTENQMVAGAGLSPTT